MKTYQIKTLKNEKYSNAILSLKNDAINIELDFKLEDLSIKVVDEYPFFALVKIRLELEKSGIKILCNGSRRDVYPSGNSITGIMAYELQIGKQAKRLVCIFDTVNNLDQIGTVTEQRIYREKWLKSF